MSEHATLTIPRLIAERATAHPDAPALLAIDRHALTYAALSNLITRVAGELAAAGVQRHDRVATVLPNGPDAASSFLAIAAVATCAPLNPAYREQELDFYLSDLEPKALIVAPDAEGPAREVAKRRDVQVLELRRDGENAGAFRLGEASAAFGPALPEHVALVLHTSGTTSRPKLVPLTQANLCTSAANVAGTLRLRPDDRCLNVMPLFHIHGLVAAVLSSLHAGASVVCTPGFHATSFFPWLEEVSATWYTAVPTIHQAVAARASASSKGRLRFARSSSAALPKKTAEELEHALGAPVIEAYGMTEAAHQMASNPLPPYERKLGSVGLPAGPEIAVLDEHGTLLPSGAIGEVAIRGANVFSGYERNPSANDVAFSHGWFRTGDEGFIDQDGYLFLRGRLKEIINRGGEKIAPGEVEDALLAHPAVAQAIAFSLPDARLGEEVGAAVVLNAGASADERELQRHVGERLAPFKVPRRIVILDEIPKGATGKLRRIGMAEQLGLVGGDETSTSRTSRPPESAAERRVAGLWEEILHVEHVGADDDFFALGGDSILAAELISRLREEGATKLWLTALVWAPTVALLAREIESADAMPDTALVPLRKGAGRPLFVVHALDGEVVRFGALARCLPGERPLYGLKALGVEDQDPRHGRVEDMAAHYVREIRGVQPHGPYLIGALCMGAPIALEMAQTLMAEGEQVAPLVFIDPNVPPAKTETSFASRLLEKARLVSERLRGVKTDAYGNLRTPFLKRMAAIRDAYVMAPYPGKVTIVLSDQHAELGWLPKVAGGAVIHEIGGTHMELLRHPKVEKLAELVDASLEEPT